MTRQELRVVLDWYCGCGLPEDASAALLRLLELHPLYEHREAFTAWVPDDGVEYLLLYTLDHLGLTEHGVSVGGAWLTAKGTAVRDALRVESADDFAALHADHCACGFDLDDDSHSCFSEPVEGDAT